MNKKVFVIILVSMLFTQALMPATVAAQTGQYRSNASASTPLAMNTFEDVPSDYWAYTYIEQLYAKEVTGGCSTSPLLYCPETTVTRSQMAVFLLRGIHGSSYSPPAVGGSTGFGDVPTNYWAASWIKQLAAEGITGGCGSGNYCPEYPVTRDQMAVFLLRSKYGSSYNPPPVGAGTGFGDVPTNYWAAAWIKQLVTEGITAGCGSGNYCPDLPVSRAQMAVFLGRVFMLDRVQIRWFVGLGTGSDPVQFSAQQAVANDFNNSQNNIRLILNVEPFDTARTTLASQIASGKGPDIIGPVGWGGSNEFYGKWLDLTPYIASSGFDTSVFDPSLVASYHTEEGQVGLPFLVFPSATYYVPAYFDTAGLAYPPAHYGDAYVLDSVTVEWNWNTLREVARRLTLDINGKNATEVGFDKDQIVQVGFEFQWASMMSIATFRAGAVDVVNGSTKGSYSVNFPASWKDAFSWYHDGMYGIEPFISTGPMSSSPSFGDGNVFNSGKAAMAIVPIWYTCCLGDFVNAGHEFQAGALPVGDDAQIHGRVDADTFRIWKGTKYPAEAFEVLSYLIGPKGIEALTMTYGGMAANKNYQDLYITAASANYPFVTTASWDIFKAGLAYADIPSAEQWQPNMMKVTSREGDFLVLLKNTPSNLLDFNAEWQNLINDLNTFYNE